MSGNLTISEAFVPELLECTLDLSVVAVYFKKAHDLFPLHVDLHAVAVSLLLLSHTVLLAVVTMPEIHLVLSRQG